MQWKLYADGSLQTLKHDRPRQENVPGGWACVLKDREERLQQELSGALLTPNIYRMEMLAVMRGLEVISRFSPAAENSVRIFSKSKYVFRELLEFVPAKKKTDFRRLSHVPRHWLSGDRDPWDHWWDGVRNDDLCIKLHDILRKTTITFAQVLNALIPEEHKRCHTLASQVRRKLAKELGYL